MVFHPRDLELVTGAALDRRRLLDRLILYADPTGTEAGRRYSEALQNRQRLLDDRGVSKKFEGDWSFTATQMKSAVQLKGTAANSSDVDEFWQVEVVIPFADLGQSAPKPKDTWRANFYRFNRGKNQKDEALSWSPTRLRGFHQPSRFGFLEFGP